MAETCMRCGRPGGGPMAVLPQLRAVVCLECFRAATGRCPLPAANGVSTLAVRGGQFVTHSGGG